MPILSNDDAKAILTRVMKLSKADDCEALLSGSVSGNIRYARNSVSTAGTASDATLAVQSNYGKRVGTATVNEFDDDSLARAVRRSEELARLSPENPEFMPVLGPQKYVSSRAYFDATANISPTYRARAAADSIEPSRKADAVAAGFLTDSADFQALMNSQGLYAYHQSTNANLTVTVRTTDGTGSGWASRDVNDVRELDAAQTSRVAIDKAVRSRNPRALEPGKYTVILEPSAASGLIAPMLFSFDARQADEGRSFLSKKGGNKLGEKMFDQRVNIYADPSHPQVPAAPWNNGGEALQPLQIVKDGAIANLFYSRYWAEQRERDSVPFPNNVIFEGGKRSLDAMIGDTQKGILVTRTWYIRSVDPQTLLYTGLTRDGTFYIEDGKLKYPLKNFRFNESPVIMLNNLEELGRPQRVSLFGRPALIPPMKIREFTFSSLSDAV